MIGDESDRVPERARPGRGAATNRVGRFEPYARVSVDDGWELEEETRALRTEVAVERPRSVITRNTSPDVGFDRSINPYRGCEHGCVYCFARPSHAYLGLSPGLDFETKITAKPNAAEALERELAVPDYVVRTMAMGTNTDPYQPLEKRYEITRKVLEVLERTNHPVRRLVLAVDVRNEHLPRTIDRATQFRQPAKDILAHMESRRVERRAVHLQAQLLRQGRLDSLERV